MRVRGAIALAAVSVALASCCLDIGARDSDGGATGGATTGGSCHAVASVSGRVTTLAGFSDGGAAEFISLRGIAVDSIGNVYVSDYEFSRIDKIDCLDVTSVFNSPSAPPLGDFGIAVDSAGNVYAASNWTSKITKTDQKGNVTIVAGNGAEGWVDGSARDGTAEFNQPDDVAVDSLGNVFVADTGNNRIRKIDASGNVTTLAGDGDAGYRDGTGGPEGSAELNSPGGLAVDASGNVFVADTGNNRIRRIDGSGNVTTLAGDGNAGFQDGTGGPQGTAQLKSPEGVAVDASGNLYIADAENQRIRKIDPNGNVTTLAGNGTVGDVDGTLGPNGTATFRGPEAVAVDAFGNIYVADDGNARVRMITP